MLAKRIGFVSHPLPFGRDLQPRRLFAIELGFLCVQAKLLSLSAIVIGSVLRH
jgi:hypothetical protein